MGKKTPHDYIRLYVKEWAEGRWEGWWSIVYSPSKRFLTIEFFSLSIAIFECSQRSIQHNLIGKKWKEEEEDDEEICSGSGN